MQKLMLCAVRVVMTYIRAHTTQSKHVDIETSVNEFIGCHLKIDTFPEILIKKGDKDIKGLFPFIEY